MGNLRTKLIRLAYENPGLRSDLLPLLGRSKTASMWEPIPATITYVGVDWLSAKIRVAHPDKADLEELNYAAKQMKNIGTFAKYAAIRAFEPFAKNENLLRRSLEVDDSVVMVASSRSAVVLENIIDISFDAKSLDLKNSKREIVESLTKELNAMMKSDFRI